MKAVSLLIIIVLVNGHLARDESCVKWGNTFDVSLESVNVRRNCDVLDEPSKQKKKICCAAIGKVNETHLASRELSILVR